MIKFEELNIAVNIMYDRGDVFPDELVESIKIEKDKISLDLVDFETGTEIHRTFIYRFDVEDPDTKTLTGD